ncbi:MAG TPA: adenylyltransferase/cytidyltransferase family protein [Candidatus Thermoplasmatota archaeon]|nr:adenylyltransferase/cytidyltransferase family protein [Candidatus Thermoplasmatota archaeon]
MEKRPGVRRVMAAGVFDLLHLGHVHYLTEAKKMGDELVVVVATDVMVAKRKHQPIVPQEQRLALVAALKPVDVAILGSPVDQYQTVAAVKPDVIALGYDDYHIADDLRAELSKRGMGGIEVARCPKFDEHDLNGTRKIVRRILDLYDPHASEEVP